MTNPFIFIVGCPRSGTTLLYRLVDAHKRLAIIHETQWVASRFEKRTGITTDGMVTDELVRAILDHRRFGRLQIEASQVRALVGNGPVTYEQFVSRIFDLYGAARDKSLVGEKSPGYVRHLQTLHSLWPDAKFIHLIRDGRDVCRSILDWRKADRVAGRFSRWEEDRVSTCALYWEQNVRLGREAGLALGGELYKEIRYESLVMSPEQHCREICEWLGIEYDEGMLHFHDGRTRRAGTAGRSKRSWLPPTPGIRNWREDLTAEEVGRFEAIAGELLEDLGYERAGPAVVPDLEERAVELKRSFVGELVARRRTVPLHWREQVQS